MSDDVRTLMDQHGSHVDSEHALLGAAFLRPAIVGWLEVKPDWFFSPVSSMIWGVMQRLQAAGSPIDSVTVSAELEKDGRLDACGGIAFLSQLLMRVPTADNVEHYVETIRERYTNRSVLLALGQIESFLRGGTYGEELLDEAMGTLSRIERPGARTDETDWATSMEDELAAIEKHLADERAAGQRRYPGIPTGITKLDDEIGGVPKGIVTLIGARPGEGKSSVLLNWASTMVSSSPDEVGLIFTYEDRFNTFAQRGLAQLSGIDGAKLRRRDVTAIELIDLKQQVARLSYQRRLKLFHAHGMRAHQLRRIVLGCRRRFNVGWIAADYVQNMPPPERGMKTNESVAANMQVFQELAGQENIGVIVLSQLNRDFEGRKGEDRRPRMTDFKDSGALEEKAKFIIALYDNPKSADDVLELVVLKNHAGEGNVIIECIYDRARCLLRNKSW